MFEQVFVPVYFDHLTYINLNFYFINNKSR